MAMKRKFGHQIVWNKMRLCWFWWTCFSWANLKKCHIDLRMWKIRTNIETHEVFFCAKAKKQRTPGLTLPGLKTPTFSCQFMTSTYIKWQAFPLNQALELVFPPVIEQQIQITCVQVVFFGKKKNELISMIHLEDFSKYPSKKSFGKPSTPSHNPKLLHCCLKFTDPNF